MHERVVVVAERDQVGEIGCAAVSPPHDVMDLAPSKRSRAVRDRACRMNSLGAPAVAPGWPRRVDRPRSSVPGACKTRPSADTITGMIRVAESLTSRESTSIGSSTGTAHCASRVPWVLGRSVTITSGRAADPWVGWHCRERRGEPETQRIQQVAQLPGGNESFVGGERRIERRGDELVRVHTIIMTKGARRLWAIDVASRRIPGSSLWQGGPDQRRTAPRARDRRLHTSTRSDGHCTARRGSPDRGQNRDGPSTSGRSSKR
jgi:hypothetical protein